MATLFRLIRILRVAIRYRLDQLLPRHQLPWWVRMKLLVFRCFPQPDLSRGQRLRKACEDLGPIFVKFGQLLSTRPDLIAPDIIAELDHLQDNVPPFSSDRFRELVETALGDRVDNLFADFEHAPLASASVAQVHAATLHDGRAVVVKVIRPEIEHVIDQDVKLLLLLARLVARYSSEGRRLRPVEVVEDYRRTIFDELDLHREAANASQLRRNFAKSPLLYVPEIYWDYTRRGVLVMERIYGIPITHIDALERQHTDMKLLAERGVEIFFTQVFKHNFFHADMHPGNIFVSTRHPERPQYIAVDMAIVGSLTNADQYYLARNLLAMFRRDYRQVAELHVQSGWVPPETPVNDFEAAIRSVCEPIFEKPLKEISFGQVLINLFQTARRFNMEVQPQLVLLQKTLLNIEGLGRQLYPDLDLWTTAHPYMEQWLEDRFRPAALWQQLKRHGPEWLEKFPEVPHLVFQALEQAQIPPPGAAVNHHLPRTAPPAPDSRGRRLLAVAAFTGAALLAWPQWGPHLAALPLGTWVLAGVGACAWLMR
ncbi:ubiquinone biosynthesis regulatory protein kinase UbiB [Exilibacterium tricleocarpae]|uniref:Probable protein kinase UbiB n=1 Tax=Exilibacterium tricleocarpae TaxID=2591008 RepID=A0A545T607_9GAMM|nr:ubiquinone biosynthesis regulatory protein kinase UbiB [Exilibacterium tricleocarpae]TQV72666.1 ubiquinone biosynthesis regulatory protein kinase UbiB [Exilibacterium tricleocarpae]